MVLNEEKSGIDREKLIYLKVESSGILITENALNKLKEALRSIEDEEMI